MDHGFTNRDSMTKKGKMPMAPPPVFSKERQYSEIDVSLYSEFSDDDDNSTHNTNSEGSVKNMFSKYTPHNPVLDHQIVNKMV
jgi:hypothetical protein